nr:hypothetical protein CFP56_38891 [Quercus suber]
MHDHNVQTSLIGRESAQLETLQYDAEKPAVFHQIDAEPRPRFRRLSLPLPGILVAVTTFLLVLIVAVSLAVAIASSHPPSSLELRQPFDDPQNTSSERASIIHRAIDSNFPDPIVWKSDGIWHAFATNEEAGILNERTNSSDDSETPIANVQYATSVDFVHWNVLSPALQPLPQTGAWAQQGNTNTRPPVPKANVWAPALIQRPLDNKWVLYYSAVAHNSTNVHGSHPPAHCIGAALSTSPTGPFTPLPDPLLCPTAQGGAIDPAPFLDPATDTLVLLYKLDGNNRGAGGACGNTVPPIQPTPLILQPLAPDGLTLSATAPARELLALDPPLDGPLIEAPALVRSPAGVYFLFFSAGCTRDPSYAVRYATAVRLAGPYTRAPTPLLRTGDAGLVAPGSMAVAGPTGDGNPAWVVAFHARLDGREGGVRAMFTAGLELQGHEAKIVAATAEEARATWT